MAKLCLLQREGHKNQKLQKTKLMQTDIHFTDEQGNEWFVMVTEEQVRVFKNKTEIEDVRFYTIYTDELTKEDK